MTSGKHVETILSFVCIRFYRGFFAIMNATPSYTTRKYKAGRFGRWSGHNVFMHDIRYVVLAGGSTTISVRNTRKSLPHVSTLSGYQLYPIRPECPIGLSMLVGPYLI